VLYNTSVPQLLEQNVLNMFRVLFARTTALLKDALLVEVLLLDIPQLME